MKVSFRHYNLITGNLTVSKQHAVTADNRFSNTNMYEINIGIGKS